MIMTRDKKNISKVQCVFSNPQLATTFINDHKRPYDLLVHNSVHSYLSDLHPIRCDEAGR